MKTQTAREEIPDTKQGCITYIAYRENQIKENLLNNRRLKTRMGLCLDKLAEFEKGENEQ